MSWECLLVTPVLSVTNWLWPEVVILQGNLRQKVGLYTAEITEDSVLVWKQVGELPSPVAYGVSISRSGEMILIGGNNADGGLTSVFRLKLAEDGGAILDTLPSLPLSLIHI